MHNPEDEKLRPPKNVKKRDEEFGIILNELFLLDDIIMDILSRLPIKDVLRFQCVCKKGKELIASLVLSNFQIKRSVAMIFVINTPHSRRPFLLSKCWESERKKSIVQKSFNLYPDYTMQLSHYGLIVSEKQESPGNFIIFNPIYSESVKITVPSKPKPEIFGVFYKRSIREYCTLWEVTVSSQPLKVQYKMLNLGAQPNWREIANPLTQNGRIQDIGPVLVNEYLYWVVKPEPEPYIRDEFQDCSKTTHNVVDIMEFDTRSERFEMIPCPVLVNFTGCKCDISLLHVNGLLWLVQFSETQLLIDIWSLEDRVNKTWTNIIRKVNILGCIGYKAVALWNGEIIVQSSHQELYVFNLKLERRRKFGRTYRGTKNFLLHVMSLASLKNCMPEICIMDEDEDKESLVEDKKGTDQSFIDEAL